MVKEIVSKSLLIIGIIFLTGCSSNSDRYVLVTKTPSWEVYEVSKGVYLCVPLHNSQKQVKPIILNKEIYENNQTKF